VHRHTLRAHHIALVLSLGMLGFHGVDVRGDLGPKRIPVPCNRVLNGLDVPIDIIDRSRGGCTNLLATRHHTVVRLPPRLSDLILGVLGVHRHV
jgi:hypothetical protein